jgi:UDP-3-O-[3-hydroxymyristoyl] N-acetylglucosamine deacetylase
VLGVEDHCVETTEHLLSAVAALGVSNLIIQVWGKEIPIFNGSAASWIFLLEAAGIIEQKTPVKALRVMREVLVGDHNSWCKLTPDTVYNIDFDLHYDHPMINNQNFSMIVDRDSFVSQISNARTFGFKKDLDYVLSHGLCKGVSLNNTVVFDDLTMLNTGGLLWPDEPVRHKILDVIGDLSLAGSPIIGKFHGYHSGHSLNHQLVEKLLGDSNNWAWEPHT